MDTILKQIVEQSHSEIFIIDIDNSLIIYANATATNNLGYSESELKQKRFKDIQLDSSHAELAEKTNLLTDSKDPNHKIMIESQQVRKDGSSYPVEIFLQFIINDKKPIFVAFVEDVSDKKEAHHQLNSVIESADLGYADWNRDSKEYHVNDRWLEILGLEREEFDNTETARDMLFHPDDLHSIRQNISESIISDYAIVHDFRMKHKDGHWILMQASGTVVEKNIRTNQPIRVTSIYKDITEQRKHEIERDQFYQFFKISPDMMVATDPQGNFVKVNPAVTYTLGYSESELISEPVSNYIHPDDLELTQKHLLSRDGKKAVSYENRFLCKNGSYRWLSWSSRYDRNEGDQGIIFTIARDVTEHKHLIDELYQKEHMYRSLVESSDDVIMQYDRKHRHTYANPSAQAILGADADSFIGKTHAEMGFPEALCKVWQKSIEKAFVTAEPNSEHFEAEGPEGKQIVDWRVFPQLNQSGEVQSVISVARDITKEKKNEEEQQKILKLSSLGVLAGGIAHDFNNILTILFGNISLAKGAIADSHPSKKPLETVEKALGRATHLTSQLLTFAKGGDPIRKVVSLAELIKEVTQFDLSGSNVKLVYDPMEDLWLANIDPGQISQVISNLTINANQAMSDGGYLYIAVENIELQSGEISNLSKGRYIRLTIRDEGKGIEKDDLNQIFDPYFSTKETGNGLGLATVHSIIIKHNGHISVVSEVGQGTTFTLYLPASEPNESSDIVTVKPVAKSNNEHARILIMDDEEMIRTLAVQSLKGKGYQVEEADDGQQAIDKYQQAIDDNSPFDCLIMDLTIPGGLGGVDAIKEILAMDPNAKAIVSSGYAVNPIMSNHHEYGFKDIIAKPFTIKDLRNVVERVLDMP